MLKNDRDTAFTVSELLRENQQRGKLELNVEIQNCRFQAKL